MNEKVLGSFSWIVSIGLHLILLFFALPAIKLEMDARMQSTIPVKMDMLAKIGPPPKSIPREATVKKEIVKAKAAPKPAPEKPKEKKAEKPVVKGNLPVPQKTQKSVAHEESSAPKGMPGDRDEPVTENVMTPVYPKEALNNNWAGTVMLDVSIDKDGKPTFVDVVKTSGHQSLDNAFVRTIQNYYTFKPKQILGKKVGGKIRLSYSFKLD